MSYFDVIIPTHNRVSTLNRAVYSVLAQSFRDFNLYVVDDGSSDETLENLKPIRDSRLHYARIANGGVSRARNFGVQLGRAPWLAFLDSDDEWLPQKLEMQSQYLNLNPWCSIAHTEEVWIRNGNQVLPGRKHQKTGGRIYEKSCQLCLISPSTVVISRELFKSVGGFREDFPVCEDYDLWLKIAACAEIGFIETPLVRKFGGHSDQLSRRYKAMDYWRVKSLMERIYLSTLNQKEFLTTVTVALNKSNLLLKGFRKHQKFMNYEEVKIWQQKLLEIIARPKVT